MTTQPISLSQSASEPERPIVLDRRARSSAGAPPSAAGGMLWFAGWLFTIGFAKLIWWKALLALVLWPYFLGITIH